MEYIIIDTQEVVSQSELRHRNPDTSFPEIWGPDVLEFLGVAVVFPAPKPEFDSISQSVIQGAPVLTDKGHYEQTWTIVDLDPVVVQANKTAKLEQLKTSIVSTVQSNLDAFAKEKGYDNILSACSYATSTNDAFKTEGLRAVLLRDSSWATLYSILADVETGKRIVTSFADIETDLPVLTW